MTKSVLVLGAGIVGLSTAIHLRRRGIETTLVDRKGPGAGASFGNGGLIQREAVFPYRFPRDLSTLLRIARNRSVDVSYSPRALMQMAPALLRYFRASAPGPYAGIVRKEAALIATCLTEHLDLAREAGTADLLRPIGWMRAYGDTRELDEAVTTAEQARREFGVGFQALDGEELARAEPDFAPRRAGAVHWTDSMSLSDTGGLIAAYAALLDRLGGRTVRGDGTALERRGSHWALVADGDVLEASDVVVAMGAWSTDVTRRFGYTPPLFWKRGYHMHYRLRDGAVLNRPLLDNASRFLLVPTKRGVRLTTGVEFAERDAAPTAVQLQRAEPIARGLLPLAERVDPSPWLGIRPCMPDMIPVIGPAPGIGGMWCGFGHGHQGMTLGPTTGRLLAEMIAGEEPFLDPAPYRADRF